MDAEKKSKGSDEGRWGSVFQGSVVQVLESRAIKTKKLSKQ